MSDSILDMRADIESDAKVLAVKKAILRELKKLPDDRARRRVIIAAAALVGYYDLPEEASAP